MILGTISILVVVITTVLVAAGTIKGKCYPYCIGAMALGLVYSTTMLGTYVVGSDIQGELFASREALSKGWNFLESSVPSIVPNIIAPELSKLIHLNIIWIYKAFLPLALVGVPIVLYSAFKKQIGEKKAFFAALFFIIMPIYSLEIAQITKSMFAELFFALIILVMVSKWHWCYKSPAIIVCVALTIVCHYTIGLAVLCYLFGIFIVRLATNWTKWKLFALKQVPIIIILIVFVAGTGCFYTFYHYASGGGINNTVGQIAGSYKAKAISDGEQIKKYFGNIINKGRTIEGVNIKTKEVEPKSPEIGTTKGVAQEKELDSTLVSSTKNQSYLYNQGHLVKTGIGLDFTEQPVEGKLFRIIQYITQLLMIIGSISLLLRPQGYKFTAEFVAGIGCSLVLLLCCIFLPGFSSLINMTRFYQISLFFLAPMLVVGCETLVNIRIKR